MNVSNQFWQLGFIGKLVDAVEHWLQWGEPGTVDSGFVHAGGEVIADLLVDGGAVCRRTGGLLQRLAHSGDVPQGERIEGAPSRLVGRNRVRLQPLAARVLEEIRTGIQIPVDHCRIKLFQLGHRRRRGRIVLREYCAA